MSDSDDPITYHIKFEKDHANIKVTYDFSVPVGGPTLIADFQVTVDGANLFRGFLPGQTYCNGVQFHVLRNPDKDAAVSYTMSSDQGWDDGDDDVLRGEKSTTMRIFQGSTAKTIQTLPIVHVSYSANADPPINFNQKNCAGTRHHWNAGRASK